MCVEWTNDWEIAAKDITAFKVVRRVVRNGKKVFESPTRVEDRADQGYSNHGSVLQYRVGTKFVSDEPGFYCTAYPMKLVNADMAILEVLIPKGTKFRRGRAGVPDESGKLFEMPTLNATNIKIIREFKGAAKGSFKWPQGAPIQPYAVSNYVWSYAITNITTSYITVYAG